MRVSKMYDLRLSDLAEELLRCVMKSFGMLESFGLAQLSLRGTVLKFQRI